MGKLLALDRDRALRPLALQDPAAAAARASCAPVCGGSSEPPRRGGDGAYAPARLGGQGGGAIGWGPGDTAATGTPYIGADDVGGGVANVGGGGGPVVAPPLRA